MLSVKVGNEIDKVIKKKETQRSDVNETKK